MSVFGRQSMIALAALTAVAAAALAPTSASAHRGGGFHGGFGGHGVRDREVDDPYRFQCTRICVAASSSVFLKK
jgi:hypothetical protein